MPPLVRLAPHSTRKRTPPSHSSFALTKVSSSSFALKWLLNEEGSSRVGACGFSDSGGRRTEGVPLLRLPSMPEADAAVVGEDREAAAVGDGADGDAEATMGGGATPSLSSA